MESPFRGPKPDGFRLIETMRWEGGVALLALHLDRLERTARRFGIAYDAGRVRGALAGLGGERPMRVRLTLAPDGTPAVTTARLEPEAGVWAVRLAEVRLDPGDPWLGVKTTERAVYDRARASLPKGVDEMVFLNTRGEIAEGAITSVFLEADGALLTPPLSSGVLPGVLRESLLRAGRAREAVLRPVDLDRGRLFVGNALRGLIPARMGRGPA